MNKKTILLYGDSNTHGTKPMSSFGNDERFHENERWGGILRHNLKEQFNIIEEGLPGRTTVHDDPIEGPHRNGLTYLRPCLKSHLPIDIIVLMLGTNDLKSLFPVSAEHIAHSIEKLILEIIACNVGPNGNCPELVLLCPPPIQEVGIFKTFFAGGAEKSKQLSHYCQQIAKKHNAVFLDLAPIITVSNIDGIHYDQDQHIKLAQAVQQLIENL
ncbi:lipolytic enzyme, G-D-S-L [Commensalibacter intestini A911]|uniref:Hydrolase n=2 Tax=Commensalibacter intestini TaxID=479936 RepID=A0A251ZVQ6_9PROT|nr:SGNH/GDSL hydrolase family protein [Commensalibacter intestini]EHD13447.1 lipolytic enzyme, G-D-S-L [Commensalibacter intestini A911]OUI78754.1 hydrolase [Commensalibacter intestini]